MQARKLGRLLVPAVTYLDYAALYPELIERLSDAKTRALQLRRVIEAAVPRSRRRSAIHKYLISFDVRLHAVYQGVRDTKQFHRFPPAAITAAAQSLDVFSPMSEPVRRSVVVKNGKRRRLISFGPLARARQQIAADVLRAVHQPLPTQFTLRGGVTSAILALEQAFREGYVYGQEVDLRDFFPSIHSDGLVTTLRPLPRAVVENVVWSRVTSIRSRRRYSTGAHSDGPPPPREYYGLAQGSASSPIAADIIMSEVLRGLPEGSRFVCFADNVIMLGETENRVAEQVHAFQTLLREHPAGPLGLRAKDLIDFRQDLFSFLGYEGRYSAIHDRFEWDPKQEALNKIDAAIEERTASLSSVYEGLAWLRQWRRAYPMWEGGNEWVPVKQFELLAKAAYSADRITYAAILRRLFVLMTTMASPVSLNVLLPEAPPNARRGRNYLRNALRQLQESGEAALLSDTDAA